MAVDIAELQAGVVAVVGLANCSEPAVVAADDDDDWKVSLVAHTLLAPQASPTAKKNHECIMKYTNLAEAKRKLLTLLSPVELL